jgi:very-short-patch-repair endonuclease
VLWELVRGRKLLGSKFRRQAPIGRFIVDFLCHERARVVEADGPIHVDRVEYDAEREAWLARQGFTVLRFSNAQVLSEPHAVQRRILATLSRLALTIGSIALCGIDGIVCDEFRASVAVSPA